MRYLALCCDYDGTIAHHGRVDADTLAALERFTRSGRKLVLVTGRELDDLQAVFPHLDLFDRVVAENGAMIYRPATHEERLLGDKPPDVFAATLSARGVAPLSTGRVIVATWEPHENAVLETIHELGLELQVIFNKGAVMVLPTGVNKATGLRAALEELNLSPHNAVGVGDAENDHAFLSICECSVAVANALPALMQKADIVTISDHGAGVSELIAEMLANDLQSREPVLGRHHILLGHDNAGAPVSLPPYGINTLVVGTSGGGKSSVAIALIERLHASAYSFCIIDPEGDYDNVEGAIVLGSVEHAPSVDECIQLLCKPDTSAVINLLGLELNDRPRFFLSLFLRMRDLRASTGRPHWLIVDEAHHILPAQWQSTDLALPSRFENIMLLTVAPHLIAGAALNSIDTVIVLGDKPKQSFREFTDANALAPLDVATDALEPGMLLLWRMDGDAAPLPVRLEPAHIERRRHLRKYAEGELLPDRSFYFRGPENKLKLRARNLIMFLDLADGVDDDTWLFHLRKGDISAWLRCAIKDEELAEQVATVERKQELDARASRQDIRKLIETVYTLPAEVTQ